MPQSAPAAIKFAAPSPRVRPVVVKLGGSVLRSGELEAWLDAIARFGGRAIVVPGGGALADEVRASQARLGFGNAAAHRMALLAMDQLAWAVAGLRPGFEVGLSEATLGHALARGLVAVWAPYQLVAERPEIPQSWNVTSDSLALWLAGRIGAAHCYLIKSIARSFPRIGADELSRQGIVDAAFPDMLHEAGVPASLLGRGDRAAFAAGEEAGAPIIA